MIFRRKGLVILFWKVAKKASVLRRRKSRYKLDVQGNNISASQVLEPTNGNENEDFGYYVEDNKYGESDVTLKI